MTWRDIYRVAKTAGWSIKRNANEVWLWRDGADIDIHFEVHAASVRRVSLLLRAACEAALDRITR